MKKTYCLQLKELFFRKKSGERQAKLFLRYLQMLTNNYFLICWTHILLVDIGTNIFAQFF